MAEPIVPPVVRVKGGKWFSTRCPDMNCDGTLTMREDGWWQCTGLTHKGDDGELEACRQMVEAS